MSSRLNIVHEIVFLVIVLFIALSTTAIAGIVFEESENENNFKSSYTMDAIDLGIVADEQQGGGGLVAGGIRLLNGNVVDVRTDISLPSVNSMGLSFSGFYNSRLNQDAALGYGWSHTYSAHLDARADGSIQVTDATGRSYFFENNNSEYTGLFSEASTLTGDTVNGFEWARPGGSMYGFAGDGVLQWLEDEKGNRISLIYGGDDALGSAIDEETGRVLAFNYSEGKISSITGPATATIEDGVWVQFFHDENGNLTKVLYPDGSGVRYAYDDTDDSHNLTEKRNTSNHLMAGWAYDSEDRVVAGYNPGNSDITIEYQGDDSVKTTDAYGTVRTFIMASINNRKRVTSMTGKGLRPFSISNAVKWVYDDAMNLLEVEYAGGTVNRFSDYDNRGNPQTITIASGTSVEKSMTLTFHPVLNSITGIVEPNASGDGSKETLYDYDDTNLLQSIIQRGMTRNKNGFETPFEYVTSFTYNSRGQTTSVDGPATGSEDTTTFDYDNVTGDLRTMTRPLIGATRFSNYDAAGKPGLMRDVNGETLALEYDARGRALKTTSWSDGGINTTTYNIAGNAAMAVDPDGVTMKCEYGTDYGRLTRQVDAAGNYTSMHYDNKGHVSEIASYDYGGARVSRKRMDYNHPHSPGMLYRVIKQNNSYTRYNYDNAGNPVAVTNPNGVTTFIEYDALGRRIKVTQPGRAVTLFTYDAAGNTKSVTDAEGHTTTFEFDDMGRTLVRNSPDTGITRYAYDESGKIVSRTDARGITATFTYDALNRMTSVSYPDPSEDATFEYDAGKFGKGQLTGIIELKLNTYFSYDKKGRVRTKMFKQGISTDSSGIQNAISRTYTKGGRVSAETYWDNNRSVHSVMDYQYSETGQIKEFGYRLGSRDAKRNVLYGVKEYGVADLLKKAGAVAFEKSAVSNRVGLANVNTVMEHRYEYDNNGNMTSIRSSRPSRYNQTFKYDAFDRLIKAKGAYGSIEYTYDRVGNRLSKNDAGEVNTYTYYPGTNRIKTIAKNSRVIELEYDAAGNTTRIGDWTYEYNQRGRLSRVFKMGKLHMEHDYNTFGQRVRRRSYRPGIYGLQPVVESSVLFAYDLNGNLYSRIVKSDTEGRRGNAVKQPKALQETFVYMGNNRVGYMSASRGRESADMRRFVYDHRGATRFILNAGGSKGSEVNVELISKPFGELRYPPNLSAGKGTFAFYALANMYIEHDEKDKKSFDGNLYQNGFRFYNEDTGRYMTPDPIGFSGGDLNLYAYVGNNPITRTDPWGLFNPLLILPFMEAALSAYEGYDTYQTFQDPDASDLDKSAALAGLMSGMVLPGSGYGTTAKLIGGSKKADDMVNLASPQRTIHILTGDATGGGHKFGITRFFNGKTKFPILWSKKKILHAASEVATNPNNIWVQQTGRPGALYTRKGKHVRYKVEGVYDGLKVRIIVQGNDIITAYPFK